MRLLVRLERRIETLVEGVFSRWARDRVHPIEIGRRLLREMDQGAVAGLQGMLVPNDYRVFLHPTDFAPYASFVVELLPELTKALRSRAEELGARLPGPVRVRIEPREEVARGHMHAEARLVPEAAGAEKKDMPGGKARGERPEAVAQPVAGTDTRVYRRATETSPTARLRIQAGPQGSAGRVFPLTRPIMVIGRRADQDIVLNDPSVSRAHARIEIALDGVAIVDLGSTNGTLLNGRPTGRGRALLREGDRIQIGTILLEYLAGP